MLCDKTLTIAYIIIDALDECVEGLEKLLNFILRNTFELPRVKWIVSSRNHVEQRLDITGMTLSLELTQNAEQVAHAVDVYIALKALELWLVQDYGVYTHLLLLLSGDKERTTTLIRRGQVTLRLQIRR
ncbi:hypothetical protein RRF57_012426 [Xylaria bambusicola]|uniref:Nephrocystin 3-like N-terminal domain-containing protein n=1 Tax=Xylaria bambusicola TaxID=326684 RepID=A0AAN7UY05_9PEZI